jgi:hypothetical protein
MDDTGSVTSITDANGNPPTMVSYQCSNSLPYQVTNALSQITQYAYDCPSGAATGVKDPNDIAAGRAGTTYAYEATAGRISTVTRPDLGSTTYSYPTALEVDTATTATPDPTINSSVLADTFGRSLATIVGGVETSTTYDPNGRANCKSNPYTTGSPVYTCITSYDGMNRPLNELEADGLRKLCAGLRFCPYSDAALIERRFDCF